MVPPQYKENLNHGMWRALKDVVNKHGDDPNAVIQQAGSALQNSGQIDEILKVVK